MKKFEGKNFGDEKVLDEVSKAVKDKLAELEELGIYVKLGNISYTDTNYTTPCTVSIVDEDEYSIEYNKKSKSYFDLKNVGLGIEFKKGAKTYKLRGFIPRARTNIVVFEDIKTNSTYRMDVYEFINILKSQNIIAK